MTGGGLFSLLETWCGGHTYSFPLGWCLSGIADARAADLGLFLYHR